MRKYTPRHSVFAAIWIAVAIAVWLAGVPSWVSPTTFLWLNAAAVGLGIVLVTTLRSAGATRSIAHVLYETEHHTAHGR